MSIDATDLEIAKLVVTTGATAVAAWFGIRIASSQRDIARQQKNIAQESRQIAAAKLNFELFEERYALFNQVWGFVSKTTGSGWDDQPMTEFTNSIPKARFLFGDDVAQYMTLINSNRIDLITAHNLLRMGDTAQSQKILVLTQWFFIEATNCYKRFAPYLDFSNWQAQHWAKDRVVVQPK